MNLEDIKKLLKDGNIVIIENGKPVMRITKIEDESQVKFEFKKPEIKQSTEVITKEEMPLDELRVEDLPF